MFKREKDYEVATKSSLRKKDLKAFRNKIHLSIHGYNEEIDSSLFGSGKFSVDVVKLRNKMNIYVLEDGLPYFIESPRGSIMPTIFACWKFPTIISCIVIYPDVSRRLIDGADLMAPGVCVIDELFKPFIINSLCCVRVLGNPLPFAVGVCCTNDFDQCIQNNSGKIISVQQIYGDYLWKAFGSVHPNEGFQLVRVAPIVQEPEEENENENEEVQTSTELEEVESNFSETQNIEEINAPVEVSETIPEQEEIEQNETITEQEQIEQNETIPEQEEINPKDLISYYDEQLFKQFLIGICSLTNEDLPIQTSTFYSKYIDINIKNTSYKKQNRFFTHMNKENYIKIKEGTQQIITFINTENEVYIKYKSEHLDLLHVSSSSSNHTNTTTNKETAPNNSIEIINRYKIPKSFFPIFQEMKQDCDGLYTMSEARTVLNEYITKEGLIDENDKSQIIVTGLLYQALYGGNTKSSEPLSKTVSRKDISVEFSNRLIPYHAIKTQSQSFAVVKKGKLSPILVVYGKFKGVKKTVTRIFNLESYDIDMNQFMKLISKKAATSSSIQITPQQEKCIQVQGNITKQIRELFTSEYGIPSNLIEIKKQ